MLFVLGSVKVLGKSFKKFLAQIVTNCEKVTFKSLNNINIVLSLFWYVGLIMCIKVTF